MNRRILITGSQGFVGRYVTAAILAEFENAKVLGIGRSEYLSHHFTHSIGLKDRNLIKAPLPLSFTALLTTDRYSYLPLDVRDDNALKNVLMDFDPTEIIHLASGLKGDGYDKLFSTNIQGTLNLLNACHLHLKDVPIIAISSGGVYGFPTNIEQLPFNETDNCDPNNPYQFAKATEESLIKSFSHQANIPWIVLRVFNIVGPGQDERHVCGRFVSELLNIKNGWGIPEIKVDSLGSYRDFVDVRDVSSIIVHLLKRGKYNEVYNVCSGTPTLIKQVLEECIGLLFNNKKMVEVKNNEQSLVAGDRIDSHFGNNSKILATGGVINYNMIKSLKDMISYYSLLY